MKELLQIVIGEFETRKQDTRLLYSRIVKTLWRAGFSGVTVFRSSEGIGEKNDFRTFILEDIQFNNLPMIIETVENTELIQKVVPYLKSVIPHGKIVTIPVYMVMEGDLPMKREEALLLKIYVKEKGSWLRRPHYQRIVDTFQKHHLIWTTVTRGIKGFGEDHAIRKKMTLSFSSYDPIVIEAIGSTETIREILPEIKKHIKGKGIVIALPAQIIMDK